jgi:hypothetical protein
MPHFDPSHGARRLAHYTIIPNDDLDELVGLHERLSDAALVMHSALERISVIAPYLGARPAIRLARAAMRAAEKAIAAAPKPSPTR